MVRASTTTEDPDMKALVYHGPGQKAWEDVPDPTVIDPTDAVVRMETTTICGTDLHILKGDVPAVTAGRVLGHEGVGVVTEVGPDCSKVKVGDRVIISCVTKCGTCEYCRSGMTSHCQTVGGIGWIFGHLIDGTQDDVVGAYRTIRHELDAYGEGLEDKVELVALNKIDALSPELRAEITT